jgi:N-methylhydantoinase A
MHACTLAEELGMSTVLVPRAGGVLSALGLAISDVRRDYVRPYLTGLADVEAGDAEQSFEDMENAAAEDLEDPEYTRRADLRYAGQSFELTVESEAPLEVEKLEERFHATHEQRYGYRMDDEAVELVNLRLIATVPVDKPELAEPPPQDDAESGRREANFGGDSYEVPVLDRGRMGEGSEVEGPAIVEFKESTCVVRPGWRGVVDSVGTLVLEKR